MDLYPHLHEIIVRFCWNSTHEILTNAECRQNRSRKGCNFPYTVYIYIYIYRERERESTVLKRLATPSDFHIPLPSIIPFAHSQISLTHRCIYPISHPSLYITHLSPIAVYIPSLTHRCIYPISHPSLYISHLSPIAVYIPSFQVLRGRPRFLPPTCFLLIIIFGNRIRSILSTWPHQMSFFRVISSNIVHRAFIFSLIFVCLCSLEILADHLHGSISVPLILLLSSSYKLQVSAP